jgi:DNA-binding Xre family transcriptional regulator
LTPRLTALKEKLSVYRYIIEINKELDVIRKEEINFNADLFEKETEEEPTETKHDINQFFNVETVLAFQAKLVTIPQTCHYEGANSARLNMDTFDLRKENKVRISYNRLWHLMFYKGINKAGLKRVTGIGAASIAKLGKGENVTTDISLKIREAFNRELEDITRLSRKGEQ